MKEYQCGENLLTKMNFKRFIVFIRAFLDKSIVFIVRSDNYI